MWEKIKELKLMLGIVAVIIPALYTVITWTANNIVFAAEFSQYKLEETLKWNNYDEQRIRSEYYNLRNLRDMTPRDKKRLSEIQSELDYTVAKRAALEKELRQSSRIKLTQ